jgi:hypothetical protein
MPSGFRLLGFQTIALDGSSAGSFSSVPDTGGEQASPPVHQAAAVIKMTTGFRGPRHRGRVFLGPLAQAACVGGFLDNTMHTALQTAWTSFRSNLNSGVIPLDMGVASYKHGDWNPLNVDPIIESLLATQRRRQEQLRTAP